MLSFCRTSLEALELAFSRCQLCAGAGVLGSYSAADANHRVRSPVWQMWVPTCPALCTQVCWPQPGHQPAHKAAAAASGGGGAQGGSGVEEPRPQQQVAADVELAWVLLLGR